MASDAQGIEIAAADPAAEAEYRVKAARVSKQKAFNTLRKKVGYHSLASSQRVWSACTLTDAIPVLHCCSAACLRYPPQLDSLVAKDAELLTEYDGATIVCAVIAGDGKKLHTHAKGPRAKEMAAALAGAGTAAAAAEPAAAAAAPAVVSLDAQRASMKARLGETW